VTAVALGLLVAAVYGAGDFFGGLASRRRSAALVVLWSQGAGFVALLVLVPLLGGSPSARDLGLGVAAGLVGLSGVLLLYRGLALGRMAVVAPVTAVGAAFVPFVAGVGGGEGLPVTRLAGAVLALGGVVLVSRGHGGVENDHGGAAEGRPASRSGGPPGPPGSPLVELGLALGAGAAFGIVFVLLARVGEDAGLWPVLVQRAASVPTLLAVATLARLPRRATRFDLRLIVPAGLCDAGANALFVLAARAGALSVVGVVSSLYPAATVLLAALVLKERISGAQGLGLLLAGTGVVLLAL
jgi:drug/metabolite transporter (DMT)-like permease